MDREREKKRRVVPSQAIAGIPATVMDRHPPRREGSRSQVDRATSGRAIFVRKFRGYDRSLSSRGKKGERRRSIARRSAFAHSRRPETRLKCICDDNHSNAFSADQINEADIYIISKKRNREIRKQSEFPTSQILSGRARSLPRSQTRSFFVKILSPIHLCHFSPYIGQS